jgi:hypothetical protein
VVHRLLRPEVIRVRDRGVTTVSADRLEGEDVPDVRVTGFGLAKRLDAASGTVASSLFTEERMTHAAPEVRRKTDGGG